MARLTLFVLATCGKAWGWPRRVGLLAMLLSAIAWPAASTRAQDSDEIPALPRSRFRNGEETLRAFAPMTKVTRPSVVKLNVDGATVALGVVVTTNGLVLTKASEIRPGKLTCWLSDEREVPAELLASDADEDVGLVRVRADGLQPIHWSSSPVLLGQWAITPGIIDTPHAVGIISALPHRVRPQRALIGVQFDFNGALPRINRLLSGLGAEKAGLQAGDVIAEINQQSVTNRLQVIEILRDFRDGQVVQLKVQRGEKVIVADVRMTTPKSNDPDEDEESYRESRLSGQVSRRAEGFEQAIEHDTVLAPWLCGGPLVNLDGQAIGLNIARAGRVTTYALPARLVLPLLERLQSQAAAKLKPRT